MIDLENVQPQNLQLLKKNDFKVIVFVGEKQSKLSFELVAAMQSLGSNAEYIKINGNGPNALDFHIAYYIGDISAKNSDCFFHIISKDTGFDPLIDHLKSKKILASRVKDIADIPFLKLTTTISVSKRADTIIKHLKGRGNAKPKTATSLINTIISLFHKTLNEKELNQVLNELLKRKVIIKNGSKVTYKLTSSSSKI
ncbi:PIN domain-containing protein [Psychromonas sp. PT13]|uniref:PIN domain-containing protein n=1 Tax=Psychromonas sp. PT13 TaxID=3439547 RepID=UPI003EBA763D